MDDKGLDNCSQCDDFPCDGLKKRAETEKGYKDALSTLIRLQERS